MKLDCVLFLIDEVLSYAFGDDWILTWDEYV